MHPSTTDPLKRNSSFLEKQGIEEESTEPLTKAKEPLNVELKFAVCPTKIHEF